MNFRNDERSERALAELTPDGSTVSDEIRQALVDAVRLRARRRARGHEQRGSRYAVIAQSGDLLLSTVLVAPTSRSAGLRIFRPTSTLSEEPTQVLTEQTAAVAPERLVELVGHVSFAELQDIDSAYD